MINIDNMVKHYAICALWSSTSEDGEPLDDTYDVDDIAPETLADMRSDCVDFAESNAALIESSGMTDEQLGRDLWLTRNGHGAGFWDRGYGKAGDDLSIAAKVYGGVDLFACEDGKIRR